MKQILQLFGRLESLIVKHFNSVIVVRLIIVIILNHRSYIFSVFFAMHEQKSQTKGQKMTFDKMKLSITAFFRSSLIKMLLLSIVTKRFTAFNCMDAFLHSWNIYLNICLNIYLFFK